MRRLWCTTCRCWRWTCVRARSATRASSRWSRPSATTTESRCGALRAQPARAYVHRTMTFSCAGSCVCATTTSAALRVSSLCQSVPFWPHTVPALAACSGEMIVDALYRNQSLTVADFRGQLSLAPRSPLAAHRCCRGVRTGNQIDHVRLNKIRSICKRNLAEIKVNSNQLSFQLPTHFVCRTPSLAGCARRLRGCAASRSSCARPKARSRPTRPPLKRPEPKSVRLSRCLALRCADAGVCVAAEIEAEKANFLKAQTDRREEIKRQIAKEVQRCAVHHAG